MMNKTIAIVLFAVLFAVSLLASNASADTAFPGEYLIIGTQANGGGGIYEIDGGSLTFVENLPAVPAVPWGARAAYYHEANDTLYFSEGDSPAEWSVVLEDVLDPLVAAAPTRIRGFDNRGGGEQHPDIFVQGPQDGEIYAHTRGGGRLWRYDPETDTATDVGAHTAATDSKIYQVVRGNTLYTHNGDNGFRAWDQAADGSWSAPYDAGISGVLNSHATALRESDGIYFSGRSGTIAYGDFDTGGDALGELPKLDPISPLNSMEVSADGTKLWVAGFQPHVSPDTNYLGYFDISGDLDTAPFTLVVAPGGTLPGLTGNDWRISIVSTEASFLGSDLTGDGFVDFLDLTILLAHWDQEVSAGQGNLVDPLTTPVNFQDLTFLLADWTGPGLAGSPEAALGEAVPEPSTLLLGVIATLGLSFGWRRRRRSA